jgi:hypothetical protein
MKSFKEFMSESVNISGDFNGNLYINGSQPEPQSVGEKYHADVVWRGKTYQMEIELEGGDIPSRQEMTEDLQDEYPGAIVHNVYKVSDDQKKLRVTNAKRVTWWDN